MFIVAFGHRSRYFVFREILSLVSLFPYIKCLIICLIPNKLLIPRQMSIKKFPIQNFSKRRPRCSMRKDRQTDRQTDMKKLIVAFHHFANASKRQTSWLNLMEWKEITVEMYTRKCKSNCTEVKKLRKMCTTQQSRHFLGLVCKDVVE